MRWVEEGLWMVFAGRVGGMCILGWLDGWGRVIGGLGVCIVAELVGSRWRISFNVVLYTARDECRNAGVVLHSSRSLVQVGTWYPLS